MRGDMLRTSHLKPSRCKKRNPFSPRCKNGNEYTEVTFYFFGIV